MRLNYDPKKGLKNMDEMYNEIGTNHVQVNSIRIVNDPEPQPRKELASIEELIANENDIE